ncbi:glycosyltransferase [Acinetobacter sp. KB005]|uniref:glycosyltransferase n=1 Tax=Acinetobacter sp. KB005 TaxID=3416667 RepID=UPI003CE71710
MQKMLVIGDGDSAFVKDFITQYHKRGVLVDLISYGKENNNEVRIQKNFHVQLGLSFSSLKNFYKFRTEIIDKIDSDYDVIVIHFIYFFLAPYIFQLKHKTKRIVSVVWGSDFYRVTSIVKKFLQDIIYKKSDIIVFTNPKTKELFTKRKSYIRTQLAVARFGLPVLDKIDNLENCEKAQLCGGFNVPENKIKIAVGYNASLAHQQELIASQIVKFENDILDQIHLIFPMGYGNKENKKLIENILNENINIKYTILDKFYNFDEVAKLRKITDILINIQPTDQFSGSMQETLYAGGWILTGAWLPYEKIMELNPKMILIEEKEEVGIKLVELINANATNSLENTQNIRAFIKNESSWERNLPIWDKIVFKS